MTGKQHAVMWLGLLLIVLRLFTTAQWAALKAGFQSVTGSASSDSSLLGSGSGFSLPGSAARLAHDVVSPVTNLVNSELGALTSPALGPNGKPVASKSNPAGPASSPKAGAPGGSQP